MPRVNWLAVKSLSVFVGGFLFLMGLLTLVTALFFGGTLEVGRGDSPDVYGRAAQLWIGAIVALVGALLVGYPFFTSMREVYRVGRARLAEREAAAEGGDGREP